MFSLAARMRRMLSRGKVKAKRNYLSFPRADRAWDTQICRRPCGVTWDAFPETVVVIKTTGNTRLEKQCLQVKPRQMQFAACWTGIKNLLPSLALDQSPASSGPGVLAPRAQ